MIEGQYAGPDDGPFDTFPVLPRRVLSARLRVDDGRHFHAADLVGDAYYVDGVRMKRAECRICGMPLEPRRA